MGRTARRYGLIGPFHQSLRPRRVMLLVFVLVAAGVSLTTLMRSPEPARLALGRARRLRHRHDS